MKKVCVHPRLNRGHTTSAVSLAVTRFAFRNLKTKKLVYPVVKILLYFGVFLFLPQKVSAQPGPLLPGRGEIINPSGGGNIGGWFNDGVPTIKGLEAIFENVISVALAFAGIVLFVMFLMGGFRYMTAGGDAKAVEAAKGTLTHAVAGLVVLILAWIIIQFIEVLTGVNLSIFEIYRR